MVVAGGEGVGVAPLGVFVEPAGDHSLGLPVVECSCGVASVAATAAGRAAGQDVFR